VAGGQPRSSIASWPRSSAHSKARPKRRTCAALPKLLTGAPVLQARTRIHTHAGALTTSRQTKGTRDWRADRTRGAREPHLPVYPACGRLYTSPPGLSLNALPRDRRHHSSQKSLWLMRCSAFAHLDEREVLLLASVRPVQAIQTYGSSEPFHAAQCRPSATRAGPVPPAPAQCH
jgi:hypothetical protein